jgi:N-glycosylase/DNA lyase
LQTANIIAKNPEFLDQIATFSYQKAKKQLITLPGVGPKVADCVLLFAYQRYEAVPIDVWIRTIVTRRYLSAESDDLAKKYEKKVSYDDMALFCRQYFGKYAGYAQQFIYAARKR